MRSRRTITSGLLVVALLAGCGGTKAADTTSAPPPATDAVATLAPPVSTTPATLPPTSSTAPTTSAAVPTSAPTTTRQVLTLPPGVTDADRAAAEAAAIGWWEEFYRQLLALPNFDPQAILSRTVPGKPAGPDMVRELSDLQAERLTVRRGSVDQTVLLETRFLSQNSVEIQVCVSDDDSFVQQETGEEESVGLTRSFYLTVLQRDGPTWKISDWGSFRESEDGLTCN